MTEVVDRYELSPMQQSMLFQSLSAPGTGANIEQVIISVDEELDVPLFEQAMAVVMGRHTAMRSRFRWSDGAEPSQEVLSGVRLPATVADWGDGTPEEAARRFEDHVRVDRFQDFDMSEVPMMRLFVARMPGSNTKVLWTFHHALLDGRSYIVLQEWLAFYDAAQRGEVPALPPPRPYRDYIEWGRSLDIAAAA